MKSLHFAVLLLLALILATPALSQNKYGNAEIKKGKITVLRAGTRNVYNTNDTGVQINYSDVLRVGRESEVVLHTVEKATLNLGSNAVLQVEAWQRKEKKGFMRMLFGRVRATIASLGSQDRFNVQTATATIGVKGTEYTIAASPNGDIWLLVEDAVVQLTGLDNVDQDVSQNLVSAVVGGGSASNPTPAPENLRVLVQNRDLDSPAPNSPQARILPLVEALIESGIISDEQADDARTGGDEDEGEVDEDSDDGDQPQDGDTESEEAAADVFNQIVEAIEELTEDAQESATESAAPTAPVDVQFEK